MNLDSVIKYQQYSVESVEIESTELMVRFHRIGFLPGAKVSLIRRAPIFGDPLLFDVDNCQVALTKSEASCVKVSLLQGDK